MRPCAIAFGVDQFQHHNNQRLIYSFFNWYYATASISTLVGSTVLVYIQDQFGWQVGFVVPAMFMFCSALMFMLGSSLYVKVEVDESPYSGFIQVLILAFKNRKIRLLPDDRYNHSNQGDRVELTDNLRFLNKACVVRDTNNDYSGIPTVEKFPYNSSSQNEPKHHFLARDPGCIIQHVCVVVAHDIIALYDLILIPFLAKFTHEPRGLLPKTRMGMGIITSIVAMGVAAIVEHTRRNLANSNQMVNMSAMWLVPQFVLIGITEALNSIGQMEFYYSELPKSMASSAMAIFTISMTIVALVESLLTNVVDSVTSLGGGVSWLSSISTSATWITTIGCLVS
ncbi:hypothetical protein R6Q57_010620 [Mikania cordata]